MIRNRRSRGREGAVTSGTAAADLELAYRLVLDRQPDPHGSEVYLPRLEKQEISVVDLCAELVRSDEFFQRVSTLSNADDVDTEIRRDSEKIETPAGFIDVAALMRSKSVEELIDTAERYFRQSVDNPDPLLAKPVGSVTEAPELFITFGTLLRGVKPLPGARVLDFGAGTCWTSRYLAQLGCEVVAMDVSASALAIGRQSFERNPLFGSARIPEFLLFDGHHFELDDESIDAIVCFDAFHHVPNPEEVLAEMARVLVPGGLAGFAEPGPYHSHYPQSQLEMRNFGVVENDMVIEEVAEWAERSGFTGIRVVISDPNPLWCSLPDFQSFLHGQLPGLPEHLQLSNQNVRIFALKKEGEIQPDSRDPAELNCELEIVRLALDEVDSTGLVRASGICRATNTGRARWLPAESAVAGVQLGVRLKREGEPIQEPSRYPIPGDGVGPGESREILFSLEIPAACFDNRQPASLEFDLVSEGVCWFAAYYSSACEVRLGDNEQP